MITRADPLASGNRAAAPRSRPETKRREPHGHRLPRNGGFVAILGLVCLLLVIGLVMVLSASSVQALRQYGNSWLFFERQVMWMTAGAVVMGACAIIDYRLWRRIVLLLFAVVTISLLAVLVPGVGVSVNGSARWLGVGSWRVQPSELAKMAMILFAAEILSRRADRISDVRFTFRPVALVAAIFAALVMMQPDMGTTVIIVAIALTVLFISGTPLRAMASALGGITVMAFLLGIAEPYRRNRLLSFTNPFHDASNTGYHVVQSLVGLGSGGVAGVGLGASRAKWGFLPNAHTDFIFAIIGEETGLIGSTVVVLLFVALAYFGVRAAVRAPDRFGSLVAAGITTWLSVQALINIGAVIGILPVTGVPLPFVSFGGSSLVITMGAAGVLANVARQAR